MEKWEKRAVLEWEKWAVLKWEKKGNPRLKTVQKIAEKLNLELIYR